MVFYKHFRPVSFKSLVVFFLIASLFASPAYSVDTKDSQIFIAGFNAYLKRDYQVAITNLSGVLEKYPDTPLRDMAILWLSRSYFKVGNNKEASRYMAQFFKEYPDSPLKGTIEDELTELAAAYQREESGAPGQKSAKSTVPPAEAMEPVSAATAQPVTTTTNDAAGTVAEGVAKVTSEPVQGAEAKLESDRQETERLALKKIEAEQLEAAKVTQLKAEAERQEAEKIAQLKIEAERQEAEKVAQLKIETERQEAEKAALKSAEADRQETAKVAQMKIEAEKQEAAKVAQLKIETERQETEKAALKRVEAAQLDAEAAAQLKIETERKEAERVALEKDEAERLAVEQLAKHKAEIERVENEKLTLEKASTERLAFEQLAQAKASAERKEAEKLAIAKAESERGRGVPTAKKRASIPSKSDLLKTQAIAEYKSIVDHYPGTQSAANATARLKKLGIDYPGATAIASVPRVQTEETSKTFSLEVGQNADLEFTLALEPQTVEIGKSFAVPFEVVNRGNSPDSFIFESGLPADYQARFITASAPDLPLTKTPQLLPGESFKGILYLEMPVMSIDGERKLFPVKVLSETDGFMSQSRPLRLLAKAPILRAVIKTDLAQVSPGDRVPYRLVLLNVGSASAREVSLRVTFPPQYEPVEPASAGFKSEGDNSLVLSGLQLAPGESKELALTMQLKESALAREEMFLHADMINTVLKRTDKFTSSAISVKSVSGVTVQANADKVFAIPGQTVTVQLAITNTGNVRDDFAFKPEITGNLDYSLYLDLNSDGIRQASEPRVSHVGPLAPKEVANLLLEISTSAAEKDGVAVPLSIVLDSENYPSTRALANVSLVYSRPVLSLNVEGKSGKIRPGEVNSFELSCVNVGSSMAKVVDVRSRMPDQLELVATEPVFANKSNGEYSWRFQELGAGEKRNIRISYRIKPGTAVGTFLELKNILTYQDQVGNSY